MQSLTAKFNGAWRMYEKVLSRRPIPTQMATSAVLWGLGDVLAQKVDTRNKPLDVRQNLLTAGFGASFMGPVGHYWYLYLDVFCLKIASATSKRFIFAKVLLDSLILGPLYVIAFYAFGSFVIDNEGWDGLKTKLTKDFIPTYCAELAVWPAFQGFNFTQVPLRHQLLAVNVVSLLDATFLSWARSNEDWHSILMDNIKETFSNKALLSAQEV